MRARILAAASLAASTVFGQTAVDAVTQTNFAKQLPIPATGFVGISPSANSGPMKWYLDTAYVAYRTQAPAGPGTCSVGTGSWAADSKYFYFCIYSTQPATVGTAWQAGAIVAVATSAGSSQLSIAGLVPGGTILNGDRFFIKTDMYRVVGAVSATDAGVATVVVTRGFQTALVVDDPVRVNTEPEYPFIWARVALETTWVP